MLLDPFKCKPLIKKTVVGCSILLKSWTREKALEEVSGVFKLLEEQG
jgi:hypothetical protein